MSEKPSDADKNAMPEDIATLYARAQMQGTRYWDFSASRNEVRGQFRHRIVREQAERSAEPVSAPSSAPAPAPQFHASQVPISPAQPTRMPPQLPPAPQPQLTPQQPLETQARSGPVRVPEPQPLSAPPSEPPMPGVPPAAGAPRWFALHSMFSPAEKPSEPASPLGLAGTEQHPPVMAVCSLAGGVGKTCLVATLGRALSALGEHVLLTDTASCGLLPLYFGSRDVKFGLRTFSRAGAGEDVPVDVLNLQIDRYPATGEPVSPAAPGTPATGPIHDPLLGELLRSGRGAGRILVDVATSSQQTTSRLLRLQPTVLVPILPDMSSMACLGPLETLLSGADTFYVLNQFDVASPLHLEMRGMLQQLLGDRLLPFVLRRSGAFGEALAEGMTVIDYAPGSAAAEDYWSLAAWLRNYVAPSVAGYGGVRWSER